MPEDSSLDAFASSAADEEDDAEVVENADVEENAESEPELTAETDSDQSAETDTKTDSAGEAAESVEPAISTYAWSPEGGTCANCGESAEKRWRAEGQRDGDLVCADCKEW